MDSVSHFDDIPMPSVAEDNTDSAMDVTPHALSPSRRASFGDSVAPLFSTPLSVMSGLTGEAEVRVYRVCVCCFVKKSRSTVAESSRVQKTSGSADV
jgi:hypothetical protein